MPAPVPPGYTRGPILFLGPTSGNDKEHRLLQRFVHDAGDYGARLALVGVGNPQMQERLQRDLEALEVDTVTRLSIGERSAALDAARSTQLEQATGILLVADSALQLAGLIGGTPLAQTIRRANAQGKVVCGIGRSASILCQHMIAFESRGEHPHPFVHRRLVQFAPGLGMVNRLLLDVEQDAEVDLHSGLARLLSAVAYNPFLVGVSIEADTGVAVYADTTLEAFGANNVLIVDGGTISHTDVNETQPNHPTALLNATLHVLSRGYTFNFDTRQAHRPAPTDIPEAGGEKHVTF